MRRGAEGVRGPVCPFVGHYRIFDLEIASRIPKIPSGLKLNRIMEKCDLRIVNPATKINRALGEYLSFCSGLALPK